MTDFLAIERHGAVVVLTMNSPDSRNALTGGTAPEEFVKVCASIDADRSIRAVILTGAGPAFSAGGNIAKMRENFATNRRPVDIRHDYRQGIQRIPLALYNLEVPTIAAVNGAAIGAGLDLACMCDIRLAANDAIFAESFVKLGIVPGDGGAWLLPRVVSPSRAYQMSFTGQRIDAALALEWGLVSETVPPADLMPRALALADEIAANPGDVLRMTKRLMREGQHMRLDSLLEMSAGFQALAHHTQEHEDAVEAFLATRSTPKGASR
jgi:2-(1,2-epoxy-1,2-dihydrophenyl)acetyl-CoA isomerase